MAVVDVTLTSLSAKPAAYTLGNWPKLIRFVDDARIQRHRALHPPTPRREP
jgi:hypothetical protein